MKTQYLLNLICLDLSFRLITKMVLNTAHKHHHPQQCTTHHHFLGYPGDSDLISRLRNYPPLLPLPLHSGRENDHGYNNSILKIKNSFKASLSLRSRHLPTLTDIFYFLNFSYFLYFLFFIFL